jgi:hypothetical protein
MPSWIKLAAQDFDWCNLQIFIRKMYVHDLSRGILQLLERLITEQPEGSPCGEE